MDVRSSSIWTLCAVETEAFAPRGTCGPCRRTWVRAMMLVALATHDRRAHESGQAVCLLKLRRLRMVAVLGGLAMAVVLVCGASPPISALLAVTAPAALARTAYRAWQSAPKGTGALTVPRGRGFVPVRCLASVRRGAGAELMGHLAAEADGRGWVLVVDAASVGLCHYYEQFGFVGQCRTMVAETSGRGSRRARMVRLPRSATVTGAAWGGRDV